MQNTRKIKGNKKLGWERQNSSRTKEMQIKNTTKRIRSRNEQGINKLWSKILKGKKIKLNIKKKGMRKKKREEDKGKENFKNSKSHKIK